MKATNNREIRSVPTDKVADEIRAGGSPTLNALFETWGAPEPLIVFDPAEADMRESRLVTLLRYWRGMPKAMGLPRFQDLDPIDITSALGIVMLLEVLESGDDYRYLIYGEEIAERFGRNMVGQRTSDIPTHPSVTTLFLACYRVVIDTRRPILTEHSAPPQVSATSWRRLVMPLAGDGGQVERILVGNIPGSWRNPS
ncbi:MAG: PAS domain-containing protein [Alphaproteobacteria bacterium]|nr:PAS domain-containing protein [Alphaproteobacteria bacterium]MBO6862185.1 PAS domain-containing protein [Alphaproteobacteria bacterium]